MLMPVADRRKIWEHLFQEGVLTAKKTPLGKHPKIEVKNLHVIKALQSLKSQGHVTEEFCWKHYYWTLTNEGIQYIRDQLHLPAEIVPATIAKRKTDAMRVSRVQPEQASVQRVQKDYRRVDDKQANVGPGQAGFQFQDGYGGGK